MPTEHSTRTPSHRRRPEPAAPSRHQWERTGGQRRVTALLIVALVVVAAAIGASFVYGLKHQQHSEAAHDPEPRQADRATLSATFSVGRSGSGGTAELGGVKVTVKGIDCGNDLPAEIRTEWAEHESGLPCIVRLSGTTGTAPVNLTSGAQNLSDDTGHVYQVSDLQHEIACDKLYDHRLSVRTTKTGCLLFTLDPQRKPDTLTLIHGPNSAVVKFTDQ